MATEELEQQIAAEAQELSELPKIPIQQFMPKGTGVRGRCHGCGRLSEHLVPCHDMLDGRIVVERYKGLECCGVRHAQ